MVVYPAGYPSHAAAGATTSLPAPRRNATLDIIPIETPSLGDRSYLVHDGSIAFVVDPQRDIDRVLALSERHGLSIEHVFETHIHNDYVTGGLALARATGASYHVSRDDQVSFDRHEVADGDVVQLSPAVLLRAIATPGHTFTHLSYELIADGKTVGVFTGGSLLYGSTGRPDLLGPDAMGPLVHAQWRSVHRLADALADEAQVFPTHGFGSFCSATQSTAASSTIGVEKTLNPALTQTEGAFVAELLAGLDAYPAYYAHMSEANEAGPGEAPDLQLPRLADPEELRARVERHEWVVDLRNRTAFAAEHVPGTLNFGLDGSLATYLGWLIPWGTPLTLLGERPEHVIEAQRELVRIGIARPAAAATGSPERWLAGRPMERFDVATFAELPAACDDPSSMVLDVRRNLERREGYVRGSLHIPLHELTGRLDEIPAGHVWVHCAGGYRASIAASVLAAAGRDVVAVDDDFSNAEKAGLQLAAPQGLTA